MKRTIAQKFIDTITLLEEYRKIALSNSETELVNKIDTSIEDMKDRLEKTIVKNTSEKKPSIQSIENPKIAKRLYKKLKNYTGYRANDISRLKVKGIDTTAKATIILNILKEQGKVTNRKINGVSMYFKIGNQEEE